MFEHCRAFIAADNPNVAEVMGTMARNLGFGEIASQYPRVAMRGEHIHLTYFFADGRTEDQALLELLETVREQKRQKLCFSPVILLTEDDSPRIELKYTRFGFDDVIALPLALDMLAKRLAEQVDRPQLYVETKDYLGPDRRRLDFGAELRIAASPYTQILFDRDPQHGVHIHEREQRGYRFRPQRTQSTHFMPKLFGMAAR
jgi:DNA-binding response OmpR family regulator